MGNGLLTGTYIHEYLSAVLHVHQLTSSLDLLWEHVPLHFPPLLPNPAISPPSVPLTPCSESLLSDALDPPALHVYQSLQGVNDVNMYMYISMYMYIKEYSNC